MQVNARALSAIASVRVTLGLFLLFAAAILLYITIARYSWLLALPLLLLALNLVAAIMTNASLRNSLALLVFHLALLGMLLLVAVGQLTNLRGDAEVTTGEHFAGLVRENAGEWHYNRLGKIDMRLDGFTIDYSVLDSRLQRDTTHAHVSWRDESGIEHSGVIGDQMPLQIYGYRFYTTPNKGFAPFFVWQERGGASNSGSIHMPAYPAHEHTQALEWTIPGTEHQLWTQLEIDEVLLDTEKPSQFRVPKKHHLVLRVGDKRVEMQPGDVLKYEDGRLIYKELRSWMGFNVVYDWSLPWLFATGVVAVLALGWHYWRKFAVKPWLYEESK